MESPQNFTLNIHCEDFPGATFGEHSQVRVGIQKQEEVEGDVPGDAGSAVFTATIRVKRNVKDGRPMFSGPYVFGPSKTPFLYLSWGERRDGKWEMFKRIKIPLTGLGWDAIMKSVDTGKPLELTLGLTDAKGGPLCGGLPETKLRWIKPE